MYGKWTLGLSGAGIEVLVGWGLKGEGVMCGGSPWFFLPLSLLLLILAKPAAEDTAFVVGLPPRDLLALRVGLGLAWHEGLLVSCGHNMMQFEFLVCKGQEDSVGLPLGADGGYQAPQQVIEWLVWLRLTQCQLIHPDTSVHQTLLFWS